MQAPSALVRGIVARFLPSAFSDDRDLDRPVRLGRYGEPIVQNLTGKHHGLADEGDYFVAHNAQTGIISSLWGTSFSQTTLGPHIIITNTDAAGGKSIYLDYCHLICTAAGAAASAATFLNFAWSVDQSVSRYTSGGTDITNAAATNGGIVNVNTGVAKRNSVAQINIGVLTLASATSAARIVVPQRHLRVQNSTTVAAAINDDIRMNFGGLEPAISGILDLTTAKTVGYREVFNLPPIVIAPQHCAIMHAWSPGQAISTGITYLPEIGYWER